MNESICIHAESETNLPELIIKGNASLPIVQGGMGVGISNWRLAGAVAGE